MSNGNIVIPSTLFKRLADARIVRKSANEDVISSTVLQNDNELFFTVLANEVWLINLFIFLFRQGGGAQNTQMIWTAPAASTMVRSVNGSLFNVSVIDWLAPAASQIVAGGSPAVWYHTEGVYTGGANGGTLQLQWAQEVSEASIHRVSAGSFIKALRLV